MLEPGWYRVKADLMRIRDAKNKVAVFRAWGDWVNVTGSDDKTVSVKYRTRGGASATGRITGKPHNKLEKVDAADPDVLRLDFVDVQQGDAAVMETPGGQVVLIDGGENQMFARYLAARYQRTTADAPKAVACIVVTHGDADHFSGLVKASASEGEQEARKRIFLHPQRVFHNGLVKGPDSLPDAEIFGATKTVGGRKVAVDLVDDLRDVDDGVMNGPSKRWKKTLKHWSTRGDITIESLERGDDDKFTFLADEGINVSVLGPIRVGSGAKRGLPLLHAAKARVGPSAGTPSTSISAAHTINGHSVVLRVQYGDVRFLLAGDLNEEAEDTLVADHNAGAIDLSADVLKVPHHGSADYAADFLERVAPVVSVISSGDESEAKEYIHPRATLMGSLGRFGRSTVAEPVIFVTELAAFFKKLGPVPVNGKSVFAFERSAYGVVHVRTDGARLLVYTHTGKDDQVEAYAFTATNGDLVGAKVSMF